MNTFVYVDGFNLYYRALRKTTYKWLDLHAFSRAFLKPDDIVSRINYYTARVSGKEDPEQPKRQHAYLRALQHTGVSIHYGNFLTKEICRPLVTPIALIHPRTNGAQLILVRTQEEKGSDVNLASHLVRDAFLGSFEAAVVISADTDLIEPIRIAVQECKRIVGVVCPHDAPKLKAVASFYRHVNSAALSACQLPPVIDCIGKPPIRKPNLW